MLGYFIPLCMLIGVGIGFFRGRLWCNWYCPRGSFYDVLFGPISPKKIIPSLLRKLPFRFVVLFILFGIMTANLVLRWPSINRIGMFFVTMLTATTILGIILAVFIHPRSWCMACPIGTIANLAGKKKYTLKIDSDLCVECQMCAKVCPMQIRPYAFKSKGPQEIKDADCLKCGLCVAVCPKKALSLPNHGSRA